MDKEKRLVIRDNPDYPEPDVIINGIEIFETGLSRIKKMTLHMEAGERPYITIDIDVDGKIDIDTAIGKCIISK